MTTLFKKHDCLKKAEVKTAAYKLYSFKFDCLKNKVSKKESFNPSISWSNRSSLAHIGPPLEKKLSKVQRSVQKRRGCNQMKEETCICAQKFLKVGKNIMY